MKVKPVITIENSGKGTRVKLLDIDISTALRNVSYSTSGKTSGNNTVVLEIDINGLIDVLTEITPEDMRNARGSDLERFIESQKPEQPNN